jgi:hypothetical protein
MRILGAVVNTALPTEQPRVRAKVIADRYNVTERCVLQWGDSGKIPRIKIGKTVRFDFNAVVAAIEGGGK